MIKRPDISAVNGKMIASAIVVAAGFLIAVGASTAIAYRRGRDAGTTNGAVATTSIQSQRRLSALVLLKEGKIDKGIARLDYCLDQDVLFIAERLPNVYNPEFKHQYFQKIAEYRKKYMRVPYLGKFRDQKLSSRVDTILEEYSVP